MSVWHWAALALILGIAELFTGTAYLLWLGLSALLTTVITWLLPEMSLTVQASIFALLSIASTSFWFFRNKHRAGKNLDRPLNEKAVALIGRKMTLTEDMRDYRGHIMIDGVLWRIKAHDNYAAGTPVEIKTVEATILVVHSINVNIK
jgi:membrane protein implicated in regulation of membrane protease activity